MVSFRRAKELGANFDEMIRSVKPKLLDTYLSEFFYKYIYCLFGDYG